jgi:hypothetical protein
MKAERCPLLGFFSTDFAGRTRVRRVRAARKLTVFDDLVGASSVPAARARAFGRRRSFDAGFILRTLRVNDTDVLNNNRPLQGNPLGES